MSETPRTDALAKADRKSHEDSTGWVTYGYSAVGWTFARHLERELAEALKAKKEFQEALDRNTALLGEVIEAGKADRIAKEEAERDAGRWREYLIRVAPDQREAVIAIIDEALRAVAEFRRREG